MKRFLTIAALSLSFVLGSTPASAADRQVDICMAQAAALHKIDLRLLRAIAHVESTMNPKAVNANGNGSVDRGLMQINSWWLPRLAKYGIKQADLFDPCKSAYVGAWILAHSIQQYGMTWRAVGAYNSPNPVSQRIYAEKVSQAYAGNP